MRLRISPWLWFRVDSDGNSVEFYEVVDGQQRLRSLFEYKDALEPWAQLPPGKPIGFTPYGELTETSQERFDDYRVSVALMRDYETDEILDIFSRLQNGKPLRIGEKVKALRTLHKEYLKEIADHPLFSVAGPAHKTRDAHWNLGAVFYKAVYRDSPLDRQEFENISDFLKNDEQFDERNARRALSTTKRIMSVVNRVISEAIDLDGDFADKTRSPRLIKWTFICVTLLDREFAIAGREPLMAQGLVEYHQAREEESTPEWGAYLNTGRTGRIDTDDVKVCLEHVMNRMIIAAGLDPKDPQRFFTPRQRATIFECSGGVCGGCGTRLSQKSFHADHIIAHSRGGLTTMDNGQALCTGCNRSKGGNRGLFGVVH